MTSKSSGPEDDHKADDQPESRIRPGQRFDVDELSGPVQNKIKGAQLLAQLTPVEFDQEPQSADPNSGAHDHRPRSSRRLWLMLLVASILVASIIEVFLWVVTITAQSDWLSAIWLFAFSVLLLLLCQTFYGEWQALNRLKKQQQWQDLSGQLFDSPSMGLALPHCLDMAGCLPEQFQPLVKVWRENIQAHNSDTEILCLFEQDVMLAIDQLAVQIISKNASAAGVIIAISPFALLDMLLVLWRNLRMLNQINHLYGLSLGYWARIRLIRNIFNTMLYAGASEILADAGNYALGASLTSQLSAKIAQGMGAGVLTARIGLKAMQASRPMPWLSSEKPGLSGITKQLLAELMGQINKKTG